VAATQLRSRFPPGPTAFQRAPAHRSSSKGIFGGN
jgi:hypothetical protein